MWKKIRISILLAILLLVAVDAWLDKNQNWDRTLIVLLHPIPADQSAITQAYVSQLDVTDFEEVKIYLEKQSAIYRDPIKVQLYLGRTLSKQPPSLPHDVNLLTAMLWSLKFRFYAWREHRASDGHPSVTLYLSYHDPALTSSLQHSTALEKGRIGWVKLFAAQTQAHPNNVVLTHELLHAFGATDKYDLVQDQPIYPIGYANPNQKPLYPQTKAELMAAKIPFSASKSVMPSHLNQTIIGELTAKEIGWLKP